MNRIDLTRKHWKYYLMLEERFIESIEYVELNADNYDTYSNVYALLIQTIGAELDNVFKEYCGFNPSERKNISDYAQSILSTDPDIINQEIMLHGYSMQIKPFTNWNAEHSAQSLNWWSAFTDIKHNRIGSMKQANQKNILNILGALYLIEMMYLKRITNGTSDLDVFDETSKLFGLKSWSSKAISLNQILDVFGDMLDNGGPIPDRKYDV